MRSTVTAVAVTFVLGWLVMVPSPGWSDAGGSGIEGQVILRPVRPVERRGSSNQRGYRATISVVDATGREVASIESNDEGRFRLTLPPGTYVLRPHSPAKYPRASEQRVVIRPDAMTQVEIVYDSGMR